MSRHYRPTVSDHIGFILDALLFAMLMSLTACQPTGQNGAATNQNNMNTPNNMNRAAPDSTAGQSPFAGMRVNHIGIGVTNFEESVRWYTEKLDAREEVRWESATLPGVRLAYLNLNGFRIEIISTDNPRVAKSPESDLIESLRTQGLQHLCLEVDDVDAALAELNRRGVETFNPAATRPTPGTNTFRRVGHIRDNNGNIIEFVGLSTAAPQ